MLSTALCLSIIFSALTADSAPLTIPAQDARIRSVGGLQQGVWNLWSNGEVGDYIEVQGEGPRTITVRARGSVARGVWPLMGIEVDCAVLDTRAIDSSEERDYKFTVDLKPGTHKLALVYLNDFRGTEDRNLYLRSISVSPAVVLGDKDAWERNWRDNAAAAEAQTLKAARLSIDAVRTGRFAVKVLDDRGAPLAGVAVNVDQTSHDFLFGCNIFGFDKYPTAAENDLYKQRFAEVFNYATTGFYWRSYEPERGNPKYAETDKVLAWCGARAIRVKGHPLLWDHEAAEPAWASGQPDAATQERRVRDIMTRYKDRITYWEVVNEPSHLNGVPIDGPYRWARETAPTAKLIINDYGVMANGYPPFFDLLAAAEKQDIPFDGIGIQAHEPRTMRFPLQQVKAMLDRYATLGKPIHITEFTPTSAGQRVTGYEAGGTWDEATQAEYAVKFYTVCFAHPAVDAITWWDLCDAQSWLDGGGLLRKDLTPKPAYSALRTLIREKWHTASAGTTDINGCYEFRGFFGQYAVSVVKDGKTLKGSFAAPREVDRDLQVHVH